VLVDLNLILDVLLDRAPFVENSMRVRAAIESKHLGGVMAAHAVTTLHFLAGKNGGRAFADACVSDVVTVFEVATVDARVIARAIELDFGDFEDAVCVASAECAACDAILTRDTVGFRRSPLPVFSPEAALIRFSQA
jgi:hypothetical protein